MISRKRLLFVDDDARVRDTLQKHLRPLSTEWDMEFAGGGAEALTLLDKLPCDVLVTDLGMPGMSGMELLAAAKKAHPKMARIVLAAPTEQKLIMSCAALTHQFLNRPCEPEVLREAVMRACDLESSLRREKIGRLVARMDRLPSLPDLYVQLMETMADPECSIDDVGAIVARDISMTARILKLVNSAFFGLRQHVSSPAEAVNYLGLDTIKALVLSINAFAQFEKAPLGSLSLELLWNHSLLTAGCAKVIAEAEDADARFIDEAFVSGLLHDTGKLALAANFTAEYTRVLSTSEGTPGGQLAAEDAVFGANHAEIGGYMLGLWGLPGAIVDAVAWHHNPAGCLHEGFRPLACVHAANIWAHEGERHVLESKLDRAYFEGLGLADRLPEWQRACHEAHTGGVGA